MIDLLKEMFAEMVVKKDASLIPKYYHKDFLLYTNEIYHDYEKFLATHQEVYATDIQYKVTYDDDCWVVQGEEKLAGRVYISVKKPNEPVKDIEIILIAQYKDKKLYRLWELTYPDWSKMKAFEDIK